ncbi:MAG TPA: hypothetical protein VMX17_15370 [Candidatus Glassbacteria bacterium]|nr:hypothetical protein [Candidatus Glassbacteria bacterium]
MEKETILTQYISAWNWNILSIIFLVGSFLMIAMDREFINLVFYIVLMVGFILCQAISYYRRKRIEESGGEECEY